MTFKKFLVIAYLVLLSVIFHFTMWVCAISHPLWKHYWVLSAVDNLYGALDWLMIVAVFFTLYLMAGDRK